MARSRVNRKLFEEILKQPHGPVRKLSDEDAKKMADESAASRTPEDNLHTRRRAVGDHEFGEGG